MGPINDRLVVNISDSAVLSCNFDGNPLPRITWRLRDHDESFSRNSRGRIHVQHDGSLLIENVKQDDVGAYTCLGESELGIAENTVSLRVRGPPIITSPSGKCSKSVISNYRTTWGGVQTWVYSFVYRYMLSRN